MLCVIKASWINKRKSQKGVNYFFNIELVGD